MIRSWLTSRVQVLKGDTATLMRSIRVSRARIAKDSCQYIFQDYCDCWGCCSELSEMSFFHKGPQVSRVSSLWARITFNLYQGYGDWKCYCSELSEMSFFTRVSSVLARITLYFLGGVMESVRSSTWSHVYSCEIQHGLPVSEWFSQKRRWPKRHLLKPIIRSNGNNNRHHPWCQTDRGFLNLQVSGWWWLCNIGRWWWGGGKTAPG